MKIVVLDGYTLNPGDISWEGMEALGEVTVYDRTKPEEVVERIGDAEVVYTNKTPITRDTLDQCGNIRFIGVLATGYNIIDIEAAKEKEFRYPTFLHMELQRYPSLPSRCFWNYATISGSIPMQ